MVLSLCQHVLNIVSIKPVGQLLEIHRQSHNAPAATLTDESVAHRPEILSADTTITPENTPSRYAIVSNVQNEKYVHVALVLAYTIQKYNPSLGAELVLLLPTDHEIGETSLARLEQVGWHLRIEDDIHVEGMENLQWNYRRNFAKLRIWGWEEYRKIGFIDADCMVRGDISLLLSEEFGTISFKVTDH